MNYVNSDLFESFDVFQDTKPASINSAGVEVYDPKAKFLISDTCAHNGKEVHYRLLKKYVVKRGTYTFIFHVRIRDIGEKTHVIKVKVYPLPALKEGNWPPDPRGTGYTDAPIAQEDKTEGRQTMKYRSQTCH